MSENGGHIEINDGNAVIRGILAGADGTFSGKFSARSINAIRKINIRDGAVSSFLGIKVPSGSNKVTVVVPGKVDAQVVTISVMAATREVGDKGGYCIITVTKNGLPYTRTTLSAATGLSGSFTVPLVQSVKIVDFDLVETTTYEIKVVNYDVGNVRGYFLVNLIGDAIVEYRKR